MVEILATGLAGGGIHRSFIRSSLRSSLVYLFRICDVSQYVHDIFTSEFTTSKMLKRRSSVRNCCRIESSNRLNSIFIKFNFFIFLKYFCKGGAQRIYNK